MKIGYLLVGLLVGTMWMSAEAAPKLQLGPKMLIEGGDCLGDEILAWQRLRAERRVVIEQDDSPPIVCTDPAGRLYLVNGSGQLMTSDDNGETFGVYEPPKTIMLEGQPVKDIQAFGVLKSTTPVRQWLGQARGPLVIAYGRAGQLHIARSEDDGASWKKAGFLQIDTTVPQTGVNLPIMAGSLYPWFPVNKAKDMHNEPVETQFNNIGSAFQTDPSECDSEVGKRVRCLKKVAFLYSDKSCIGFNAGSVITFDQPE